MALSSCIKEHSREISKSEKFHTVFVDDFGLTYTLNGETSFRVCPINSDLPEQQYMAELICTIYKMCEPEIIETYGFRCVETGSFGEMKEKMLHNLYFMEYSSPDTYINGNKYVFPPVKYDQYVNDYVFTESGFIIVICPSLKKYIDCLANLC